MVEAEEEEEGEVVVAVAVVVEADRLPVVKVAMVALSLPAVVEAADRSAEAAAVTVVVEDGPLAAAEVVTAMAGRAWAITEVAAATAASVRDEATATDRIVPIEAIMVAGTSGTVAAGRPSEMVAGGARPMTADAGTIVATSASMDATTRGVRASASISTTATTTATVAG